MIFDVRGFNEGRFLPWVAKGNVGGAIEGVELKASEVEERVD